MTWVTRSGLVVLCLASSGCSLVLMKKPPANVEAVPPSEPIRCTSSAAAPVVDGIIVGVQLVRTGLAISASKEDYRGAAIDRDADILLGVSLAALFAGSAIHGVSVSRKCRDAQARHAARQQPEETWSDPYSPRGPYPEPPPARSPPPAPLPPPAEPAAAPGPAPSAAPQPPEAPTPPAAAPATTPMDAGPAESQQ